MNFGEPCDGFFIYKIMEDFAKFLKSIDICKNICSKHSSFVVKMTNNYGKQKMRTFGKRTSSTTSPMGSHTYINLIFYILCVLT